MAVIVLDAVNGANVGMIEGRCGLSFALKTAERLGVAGNLVRPCSRSWLPRIRFWTRFLECLNMPVGCTLIKDSFPSRGSSSERYLLYEGYLLDTVLELAAPLPPTHP